MNKTIFILITCISALLTEIVCTYNSSPISMQQLEPHYTPNYSQPFYFQDRHEIPEKSLETPHFIIHYREGNEIIAHQAAQEAESFFKDATSFVGYTPQEKTEIYIYPSLYSFASMGMTPYEGFAFIVNCGCPFSTEVLGADAAHRNQAMIHEFTHVLFFQMLENVSVGILYTSHQWIPEGIATYYSQSPYYKDKELLLPSIVQYLEAHDDFPESLEEITLEKYYTLMYPLSASVIQFMVDQYGEEKFHTFLNNLNEWDQTLTTTKNIDRALQESLNISSEELQREWSAYVHKYGSPEPKPFDAIQITQPPTKWVPSSWHNDKILVVSDAYENLDIYVMNVDGTGVIQLTKDMRSDFDPKFSPDGKKVAFTSRRDGYANIYIMNADGSHVKQLTSGHYMDIMGSWSPDGSKIAFTSGRSGNYDVYIMNADGSQITQLTSYDGEDGSPIFSPDGKIVFVSDRSGNYDLYIMNADGTNVQSLTNTPEDENFPCFSPDGTMIAFLSRGEKGVEICAMKSDRTGRETLITPPNHITDKYVMPYLAGYPVWSPDGSSLVFTMGNQIFMVQVPSPNYGLIVVVLAVVVSAVISGAIWLGGQRSKTPTDNSGSSNLQNSRMMTQRDTPQ